MLRTITHSIIENKKNQQTITQDIIDQWNLDDLRAYLQEKGRSEEVNDLIFTAASHNKPEIVRFLLPTVNPDKANQSGNTALVLAAYYGHVEIVEMLLAENANPNIVPLDGITAVMGAVANGHLEIVKMLLQAKADPNQVDKNGLTALHCAQLLAGTETKKIAMKTVLRQYGARTPANTYQLISLMRALGYGKDLNYKGVCSGEAAIHIDYIFRGMEGIQKLNRLLIAAGAKDDDSSEGEKYTGPLVNEITEAENTRLDITKNNKQKLNEIFETEVISPTVGYRNIKERIFDEELKKNQLNNENKINEIEILEQIAEDKATKVLSKIIDNCIKSIFSDTAKEEREHLVKALVAHIKAEDLTDEDEEILKKKLLTKAGITAADSKIVHEISESLVDYQNRKTGKMEKYRLIDVINQHIVEFLVQDELNKIINAELIEKNIDPLLLELPALLQSISIGQDLSDYNELFEKNMAKLIVDLRQDIVSASSIINSIDAEEIGLVNSSEAEFFGSYTKEELQRFFELFQGELDKEHFENPIVFKLTCEDHVISIGYFPNEKEWVTNRFAGCGSKFFKKGKDNDLKDFSGMVFSNLSPMLDLPEDQRPTQRDYIIMHSAVYSSKEDKVKLNRVVNHLNNNTDWKKIHEFTPEKSKHNVSYVARFSSNVEKVKEFKKQDDVINKKNLTNRQKAFLAAQVLLVVASVLAATAVAIATGPGALILIPVIIAGCATMTTLLTAIQIKLENRRDPSNKVNIAKKLKNLHQALLKNQERDARLPIARERTKEANKNALNDPVSADIVVNEEEKPFLVENNEDANIKGNDENTLPTTNSSFTLFGNKTLFTSEHKNYLILQKDWKKVRADLLLDYDMGAYLSGCKQYQKITAILSLKYNPETYQNKINKIDKGLTQLLCDPTIKAMPREDFIKLNNFHTKFKEIFNPANHGVRHIK